jgi:hypothetical protein
MLPPRAATLPVPKSDTRVRLVHHDRPDDAHADHGTGSAHYPGRPALAAPSTDQDPDTLPDEEPRP